MIIGICGKAGSGKDTIANYLVNRYSYIKISLADPIKRYVRGVFQLDHDVLWGSSEKRNALFKFNKEEVIKRIYENNSDVFVAEKILEVWKEHLEKEECSARVFLQLLGTEYGRNMNQDIWIDYLMNIAEKIQSDWKYKYSQEEGLVESGKKKNYKLYRNIVVPDVRFENEVMKIKQKGEVWFLERPGLNQVNNHSSERIELIKKQLFDFVIVNDSTVENLYSKIDDKFFTNPGKYFL